MSDMHRPMVGEIEEWAARHRFDELGPDEQRVVLDELGSDAAYERMRGAVAATRRELARDASVARVDPAIARDLHAALRASMAARPGLVERLLSARIPAYQAVLAGVGFAVLLLVLRPSTEVPLVQRQVVHVPVRDTIVVTREVPAATVVTAVADASRTARRPVRPRRAGQKVLHRSIDSVPASLAADSPRRGPKDSVIGKPKVERPNLVVGIGAVTLLAHHRSDVTLADNTAQRRLGLAID